MCCGKKRETDVEKNVDMMVLDSWLVEDKRQRNQFHLSTRRRISIRIGSTFSGAASLGKTKYFPGKNRS
jgi:hypothetical protein